MLLRELYTTSNDTAVFAFGRLNPPTNGHLKLVEKIKSIPGDHFLFLSHTQNKKTDPLSFDEKIKFSESFFPGVKIGDSSVRTIIDALKKIESLGYKNIVYVAGSDRVSAFEDLINKYNNKEYYFETVTILDAGHRDPDVDGIEGMSASKLREAASNGNFKEFEAGVPIPLYAESLFRAVRKGLNLNESLEEIQKKELDLIDALKDFLPHVSKELDINQFPNIKLVKKIDNQSQPTFGVFSDDDKAIHLAIDHRHPLDILRTLAHELVHYKQSNTGQLNHKSGETGSEEENNANAIAGVILRKFNKNFPQYFSLNSVTTENFDDGKKPGRKGLAKRSGVNCKQSVSALRRVAKNSSGEKQRMAHWCANMKSGRQKHG